MPKIHLQLMTPSGHTQLFSDDGLLSENPNQSFIYIHYFDFLNTEVAIYKEYPLLYFGEVLVVIFTADPAAASRHLRTPCKDPSAQSQHRREEAEDPATFLVWLGRANYISQGVLAGMQAEWDIVGKMSLSCIIIYNV